MQRVDRAICLALLKRGGVPNQFTSHAVKNGILALAVDGEFEVWRDTLEEPLFSVEIVDCCKPHVVRYHNDVAEQKASPLRHSFNLEGPSAQAHGS